jgi:hypothetical protein
MLEQVTDADEVDIVSKVLSDPDQNVGQSAVMRHLDRRADELHPQPGYEHWAEMMTGATIGYPLLTQRLRDWSFFRAVMLGQPWHADALLESSNWLQLKTAEASAGAALEILADSGRTKRIRNTARINLQHRSSP